MKKYLILYMLGCMAAKADILPNSTLTPGATYTTSAYVACNAHTGTEDDSIRNVPSSTASSVYKSYGLNGNHTSYCSEVTKGCELDHLIPLKLGGSNDPKNLWPQSYGGEWGAFKKDALEKRLIARVCRTTSRHPIKLDIRQAQHDISTNWIEAYHKYVENNE